MSKDTLKLNKAAMRFVDDSCHPTVKFSDNGDDKKAQLEMVVYSGGVIKNHWYWGNLAIDLTGLSFPKKKFPILEDHDTDKKIGFSTKMSVENNQLTVVESEFLDTKESLEFQKNSAAGFPYEASLFARPSVIERVLEDEETEVNGYSFKGPGTIWRKAIFKEASVCTFGYDPNTKSAAMSDCEEEVAVEYDGVKPEVIGTKLNNKEDSPSMNREKFKTDHPEEFSLLVAEITTGVETKYSAQIADLTGKLTVATETNAQLSADNKSTEKRLFALEQATEKQNALAQEARIKGEADVTFAEKFAAAELPDRLNAKVRKLVDHNQFVADGVLDKEAFGAACEVELADWKTDETTDDVLGFGTSEKSTGKKDAFSKSSDAAVARMLKHVGQDTAE